MWFSIWFSCLFNTYSKKLFRRNYDWNVVIFMKENDLVIDGINIERFVIVKNNLVIFVFVC